jgi:hypothetical protein
VHESPRTLNLRLRGDYIPCSFLIRTNLWIKKNNLTLPAADTIIRNAKIATMDVRNTIASALAIRSGKVQATGISADYFSL